MTKDNVNQPNHYTQAGIECIDAITAAVSGKSGIEAVCVANVIKYLWRYELKNGVEDVKKAQWYLNRLVAVMGESETCERDLACVIRDAVSDSLRNGVINRNDAGY